MRSILGWGRRLGAVLSDNRGGPWGSGGGGGGDDGGGGNGGGPRNPWGPRRKKPSRPTGEVSSLDEFLKKSRASFGDRFPSGGRPYWLYGLIAFLGLWILFTSVHRIGPQQKGVVTTVGYYSRTLPPGIGFSLPAPLGGVTKVDVGEIRTLPIPSGGGENLILTGDQNVINLSYTVRWNVTNPERFLFSIADVETTIREVAETSMRAAVARVSLDDAIGAGRGDIEQRVATAMQQLLDAYGSGVQIRGVSIRDAVPPAAVNDAFLQVSAAQQQAQSAVNAARAYAQQVTARAQGEAAQFERIYAQYSLAPEVTRRRMYYETMERILSRVDTTIVEAPGVTPYLPLPGLSGRPLPTPQPQAQGGQPR